MTSDHHNAELRRRAQAKVSSQLKVEKGRPMSQDAQVLPYELQVHRTELEMQNDELQRAHSEAEQGLAHFTQLFDFAPIGYFRLSGGGILLEINLAGARLLGAERAPLLGRNFGRFVAPSDLPVWDAFLRRVFASDGHESCELVLSRGELAKVSVRLIAITSSVETQCLVAAEDITALKQAEDQLRESQRLEAMRHLAGGLAHDFNNLLGGILGNVALAREDVGPGHPALLSLSEIHKASVRANRLVAQLLAFGRTQQREMVSQLLRPVVEEALSPLRAALPAGITLELALSAAPLHANVDAAQLSQALLCLCHNAQDALASGRGTIEVGLDSVVLSASVASSIGLPPARYVYLWVSDSGAGLDAAARRSIFEPRFSSASAAQGMGLGLSVVRSIVTAHHGAIVVDSDLGQGSTFHVYLPADAEPLGQESALASLPLMRGSGQHVLYVDDDEVMLLMVERMLTRLGYRVSCFASAQAALLAVLRAAPQTFDLLVSDYNMPEFSGLDMAIELARLRPDLPVVISSGLISDSLRERAKHLGVRALLDKQNSFEELGPLVFKVLTEGGAQIE